MAKVMIVDDYLHTAEILAMLIELYGHDAYAVTNGQDAAKIAAQYQPDIALIDLLMPHRNGYEVAKEIKAILPSITLVAISGYVDSKNNKLANDAGFSLFFTKPVDPEILVGLLSRQTV